MKKRDFLFCAALGLLTIGQTLAQQLSPEQAKAKAEAFLQQKTGLRSAGDLQLLFTVTDTTQLDAAASLRGATQGDVLLYAFDNEAGGYVIAAGDERAHAVLGYGTEGRLDAGDLPDGMRALLRQYAVEIATLRAEGGSSETEELSYDPAWQPVEPMITAQWDQYDPYYRQTPVENDRHTLTGCPATMFAQLMDYYRYQNWKVAEETWFSGTDLEEGYINREVTVQFTDTVDWSLLRRNYESEPYTEAEANEVAKLMKYTGAALHLTYGLTGSGFFADLALDHLDAVADYGRHGLYKLAWEDPLRIWSEKLYRHLAAGRPVPYRSGGGRHIFLLDGYAGEGMFHFNWGWEGTNDGYFLLTALLTTRNMHLYQGAFFNWCPSYMEPIESQRLLFSSELKIDTTDMADPAWQIQLMTFDQQPHSGTLRYSLRTSVDDEPIVSAPFDFSFMPDADHRSEVLRVPFPEYSALDEPAYEVIFWQKKGDAWERLWPMDFYCAWQMILRHADEGYEILWVKPTVEMRFAEKAVKLYTHYTDTLPLSLSYTLADWPIGLSGDSIMPVLLRGSDEIELRGKPYIFVPGTHTVQLLVSLPKEVEVGEHLRLFARNQPYPDSSFSFYSDTIEVEVRKGPELVLLERPLLPDTALLDDGLEFSFRVKNIGEKPFYGSLIDLKDDNEFMYDFTGFDEMIPAGGEAEKTMRFDSFFETGPLSLHLSYLISDGANDVVEWVMRLADGEIYTHSMWIVEEATANEEIAAAGFRIAWQGKTLCVQAPVPLQAYHIYNVKGGLVATGSASGHELRMDGSAWPTGVYVVAIETTDGKTMVYKIRII